MVLWCSPLFSAAFIIFTNSLTFLLIGDSLCRLWSHGNMALYKFCIFCIVWLSISISRLLIFLLFWLSMPMVCWRWESREKMRQDVLDYLAQARRLYILCIEYITSLGPSTAYPVPYLPVLKVTVWVFGPSRQQTTPSVYMTNHVTDWLDAGR